MDAARAAAIVVTAGACLLGMGRELLAQQSDAEWQRPPVDQVLQMLRFPAELRDLRLTLQPDANPVPPEWVRPPVDQVLQRLRFPSELRDFRLTMQPDANPAPTEWVRPAVESTLQLLRFPADLRSLRLTLHPEGTPPPPPPSAPDVRLGASREVVVALRPAPVAAPPALALGASTPAKITLETPPGAPVAPVPALSLGASESVKVSISTAPGAAVAPSPALALGNSSPVVITLTQADAPATPPTPAAAIVQTASPAATSPPSPGAYSVQIVQVIPRRGANFFDHNNPTGQSAASTQANGSPAAGSPPPAPASCPAPVGLPEVCGGMLNMGAGGDAFVNFSGVVGFGGLLISPSGGAQIQIEFHPGATATNAVCPDLICTNFQVITPSPSCDTLNYTDIAFAPGNIRFAVRLRRNGGQVCSTKLLPLPGCDTSGRGCS